MDKRVKQLLSLACVGVFTLVATGTSRAQNILVDPGAEQGITTPNPATGYGQGWAFFNGGTFSTAEARSGTQSIALVTQTNVPGAYQQFAASPGQTFVMTGFGLTPTPLTGNPGFGILQITFFNGPDGMGLNIGTVQTSPGNAATSAEINSSSPANVWISQVVTATAPATAQSMQAYALVVDFGSAAPEGVYYDDMTLMVVPEPSSVALVLTGLGCLVMFARKRRS